MNIQKWCMVMIISTALVSSTGSRAQSRDRAEIPQIDKWNLADLYASDEDWQKEKTQVVSQFDDFKKYQGHLSDSPSELLACLNLDSDLSKELSRLYSYASMKSDEDTRNAKYMGMKQEMNQILTNFNSTTSFMEPELVKIAKEKIAEFIQQEPKLKIYEMYLNDIQRRKAHMLSEKGEKIVAEAGLMSDSPYSIYSIFSNAELPYPDVTLSDGKTVKLDLAGYAKYRALSNRTDREQVFKVFWNAFKNYKGTFGADLYSEIKKDMFYARVRAYQSCLESALDRNNIPIEVYLALVKNVNDNLPTFYRYLNLRKRMLKVDTLKYSDMYAPVVKGIDLQYTIDDAKKLVLEAIKPLGNEYTKIVKEAFKNRWIDVYPNTGKRSGAYSNGDAYDVHPYILMNYNGQFNDVSTLAHELGHAMHSYFSNLTQPYPTAQYSIFVAEVASTLNEALLMDRMIKETKDEDVKLSLLMEYLDRIKGTFFRQTQFAEYELRIHEKAEKGEALTGEVLSQMYEEIVKKYYGADQGVTFIENNIRYEWAYIPHFYYNFYVYQYATSFTASIALSEKVLNKEKGAVGHILKFLSAGGSEYPIDELKQAGVDMTNSEPFTKTMAAMNRTIDEIEKILNKKGL